MRCATLLLLLLAPADALAQPGIPSPANSTVPCAIHIVGLGADEQPATTHPIEVTIRDLANFPVPGAVVRIDFSACIDVRLTMTQEPGFTLDCATQSISGLTDADGIVVLHVAGMSLPHPQAMPGVNTPHRDCVAISWETQLLATVPVAAFDLDGGEVSAGDLSQFLIYLLDPACGGPAPNWCPIVDVDYHAGGCAAEDVSSADLSVFLTHALSAASPINGIPCP